LALGQNYHTSISSPSFDLVNFIILITTKEPQL